MGESGKRDRQNYMFTVINQIYSLHQGREGYCLLWVLSIKQGLDEVTQHSWFAQLLSCYLYLPFNRQKTWVSQIHHIYSFYSMQFWTTEQLRALFLLWEPGPHVQPHKNLTRTWYLLLAEHEIYKRCQEWITNSHIKTSRWWIPFHPCWKLPVSSRDG